MPVRGVSKRMGFGPTPRPSNRGREHAGSITYELAIFTTPIRHDEATSYDGFFWNLLFFRGHLSASRLVLFLRSCGITQTGPADKEQRCDPSKSHVSLRYRKKNIASLRHFTSYLTHDAPSGSLWRS